MMLTVSYSGRYYNEMELSERSEKNAITKWGFRYDEEDTR